MLCAYVGSFRPGPDDFKVFVVDLGHMVQRVVVGLLANNHGLLKENVPLWRAPAKRYVSNEDKIPIYAFPETEADIITTSLGQGSRITRKRHGPRPIPIRRLGIRQTGMAHQREVPCRLLPQRGRGERPGTVRKSRTFAFDVRSLVNRDRSWVVPLAGTNILDQCSRGR